jgi:hypothetical protein
LAVTWNFTIDDGLELELDNMMTSFVRSPPLCPYTDSVQLHSIDSLPLLACLLAASRRRRSNDTSLLELGFGRSQELFADADFIASRSFSTALAFLATLSRRMPHDIQSLPILASFPRFHSDTSSVALSSTWLHLLPPLVRHCHFTAPTA